MLYFNTIISFQDQPPTYEVLEPLDEDNKTIVPIVVRDNEGSSQFVANKRPHVPQGMDYVQNAIGKVDNF